MPPFPPLAEDFPNLADVREFYETTSAALNVIGFALQNPSSRAPMPAPLQQQLRQIEGQYAGKTPEQVTAPVREELSNLVTLMMVAAIEARLQTDFHHRRTGKRTAPHVQPFQRLYQKKKPTGKHVTAEEILDAWKELPNTPRKEIGEAKVLLKYRHWLAHGRFWAKPAREFDPESVQLLAETLFAKLPGFCA